MDFIEKILEEKTKEVSFVELKDLTKIKLGNIIVEKDTPLPIKTDKLIEAIKKGEIENEINMLYIIDGMIFIMGIDSNFPHIDEYKKILQSYDRNIKHYILHQAMENLEKNQLYDSLIKLRTLLLLDPKDTRALFNYAIVVEEIGKEYIEKEELDIWDKFLDHSTDTLEDILDIDKEFDLAYYKLGFHYKYKEQYLKSNIIWTKYLGLSKDDLLSQEVREELGEIQDDANLETGLTYLNYKDYNKALEFLFKLLPKHKDKWNINYLIGQAYVGIGEFDSALEYFHNALELNDKEEDIYNEIGIIYFNLGSVEEAVVIFSQGIDKCEEDYKLYFNRGLSYIELKNYKEALKDIDKAYLLNPEDENIKKQKEILEEIQ